MLMYECCMFMKAERQSEPTSAKVNAIPLRTRASRREKEMLKIMLIIRDVIMSENKCSVCGGDDGIESAACAADMPFLLFACRTALQQLPLLERLLFCSLASSSSLLDFDCLA